MAALLIWDDTPLEKTIEITIDTLQNVVQKETTCLKFTVEHNDTILGESGPITIDPNYDEPPRTWEIDFLVKLPVIVNDESNVKSLISTPILIKAVRSTENEEQSPTIVETKKKTKFTTKSVSPSVSRDIGICNLDLMPLILGEKCFTEKLYLETPHFSFDGSSVSWQNLPLLTVTVWQDDIPFFPEDEDMNYLNITVESIYNLPDSFTGNLEYKAGTIVYTDSENPESVLFENGAWTTLRDVERTKRWSRFQTLGNRARLSKYKLDCDYVGVKNELKECVDLAAKVCEDDPRIEWNSLNRFAVWKVGRDAMQSRITRYQFWPFQFLLTQKTSEGRSKDKSASRSQLYQCYVDVSELLFPGKKSTRVVTQLFTYNQAEMAEKTGLDSNIFVQEQPRQPRDREKKSKTSKTTSVRSEAEVLTSTAIISETNEPTVIVIEIELYQPLVACRIMKDFSSLIDGLIPKTKKETRYPYSGDVAEEQYENCVQRLAEIITNSYRDFREGDSKTFHGDDQSDVQKDTETKEKFCYNPKTDELVCFEQYLYKTGLYLALHNTLKSKVTMLLDQRFKMPSDIVDFKETQNFIASTYTYLVEQMHVAINKVVEGREADDLTRLVNPKKLYFYAEESYELGHLDDARYYYKQVIASNKTDPEGWTQYAIFLQKIGDIDRARECCLEAIALDRKHKLALLMYAAILFRNRDYREAEIFFRTITDLYPRFAEGWIILHLFYVRTEYYPGVDLTLRIAEKCMKDKTRGLESSAEPLAWSTTYCPRNRVYAKAATFLLKLHLYELAGIALAKEMTTAGKSTYVLYYMAVEHYLSGRYEDALSHLKEAKCDYGMDYYISSLMGHCYHNIGEFEKAIECFEFARMLFDRPDNIHLIEVRMGLHYLHTGDYQHAKKLFLSVCKSSPTSQTWFGAGISFFELEEFKEAEAALSEANRIHNCNPDIWGYLCLLNVTLNRYDEFQQCYKEMIKNNLKNRKLWLRITESMEALGYGPPILTVENDTLVNDYGEMESEEQFEYDDDDSEN